MDKEIYTVPVLQNIMEKITLENLEIPIKPVKNGVLKLNREVIKGLEKIGSGYNANVFCCTKEKKILKVGDADALDLEFMVYEDLKKIGFPVLEIKFLEKGVLEKPYVDPNFFGDKLIKNLTKEQEEDLIKIWKTGIKYAMISGIPLDLKADNLWWDRKKKKWILADAGPKLDDNDNYKYEYTLDLLNGADFIKKLKGDNNAGYWRMILENGNIVNEGDPYVYRKLPQNKIDYDGALQTLHVEVLKKLQTLENNTDKGLFYLRFVDMNQEVSDLLKSNINLAEKSCYVMGNCNLDEELFKRQIETIVKLREDTNSYHSKLSYDDKRSVNEYTGAEYSSMNKCLRDGDYGFPCNEKTKDYIIRLESVLKREGAPRLQNDITVYRGINPSSNVTAFGVFKSLANLVPGDLWEDRGFVSTSSQHPPSAFVGDSCCIFEIFLKAGTPAYYVGKNSSNSGEEEIILLPGVLLTYIGKRVGDKGIPYKKNGEIKRFDTYMFECSSCGVHNRYAISPSPFEKRAPLFPYQPQDRKVGKNRLGLFHLTDIYNKYIPPKDKKTLRLMTWNVHEWRDSSSKYKKVEISNVISNLSPDILALQEVTGSSLGASCKADNGSYGETLRNEIVVKKTLKTILNHPVSLGSQRCMIVSGVELPNKIKILIGNLHLDVSSSKNRQENIARAVEEIEGLGNEIGINNIIICGDFNSYNRSDYNNESYKDLENIKKGYGEGMNIFEAVDYMKSKGYGEAFEISKAMPPKNTNIHGGRIDFIFLSPQFLKTFNNSLRSYTYYSSLSDHVSILLDIGLEGGEVEEEPTNKYQKIKIRWGDESVLIDFNMDYSLTVGETKIKLSKLLNLPVNRILLVSGNSLLPDADPIEPFYVILKENTQKDYQLNNKFIKELKDKIKETKDKHNFFNADFDGDEGSYKAPQMMKTNKAKIEKIKIEKTKIEKPPKGEQKQIKIYGSGDSVTIDFNINYSLNVMETKRTLGRLINLPVGRMALVSGAKILSDSTYLKSYIGESPLYVLLKENTLNDTKFNKEFIKNLKEEKEKKEKKEGKEEKKEEKDEDEYYRDLFSNKWLVTPNYKDANKSWKEFYEDVEYGYENYTNSRAVKIAIKEGVLDAAVFFINQEIVAGSTISQIKSLFLSAVKKAARYGHTLLVDYLINKDRESLSGGKWTSILLFEAILGTVRNKESNLDYLTYLINNGGVVNYLTLEYAYRSGNIKNISFITQKLREEIDNIEYKYAFGGACRGGHKNLVEDTIKKLEETVNEVDWNLGLKMAARGGHKELVEFFIQKGADDLKEGFFQASRNGDNDLFDFFLNKRLFLEFPGDYEKAAIQMAYGGHNDILEQTLMQIHEYKVKIGKNILDAAKTGGYKSTIKLVEDFLDKK